MVSHRLLNAEYIPTVYYRYSYKWEAKKESVKMQLDGDGSTETIEVA